MRETSNLHLENRARAAGARWSWPRWSGRAIFCAVAVALAGGAGSARAEETLIPDKNLEAVLRQAVYEKRNTDQPLTEEDLKKVFLLEGPGRGIVNLKGLEKCTNLLLIKLDQNEIADLTPLKELPNLQSLDLAKNKIADLAPLAGLTKLQYLELSGNQVTKLEPLAELTKLSALYLSKNQIADLGPLGSLVKLSSLYLDGNQVTDLAPIAPVTGLSTLDISDNRVVDLSPLGQQTQLRILLAERNQIADLEPLVALAKADAEGQRRLAPFLNVYLAENPLSEPARTAQADALRGYGVRLHLEAAK